MPKDVSARTHSCTLCGLVLNHDLHAAKNTLWLGQSLRGVSALAEMVNREPVGLELGGVSDEPSYYHDSGGNCSPSSSLG
jgi:hypothetical protein